MLSDETTYLSLLQGEKSKNFINVATLNLGAQLRNAWGLLVIAKTSLNYLKWLDAYVTYSLNPSKVHGRAMTVTPALFVSLVNSANRAVYLIIFCTVHLDQNFNNKTISFSQLDSYL